MTDMKQNIKDCLRNKLPELIAIRRHIHKNPELSFQEHETMKYISQQLSAIGVNHEKGVAKTGIVALIGDPAKPCVALRADIDALPMFEKTSVAYCSRNEGVMHACGHDVHTTCLIGAAMALKLIESNLNGCVKLIFQPAEEKLPGGALEMIAAGVLSNHPVPKAIFGLHVHPPLEVGTLGFKPGIFMASADELTVTFRGRGGHAAVPREFDDPISAAASFIMQVQQVVSRKADPAIPTVVSFGKIETKGGSFNIIPETVVLQGTLRTMNEEWRGEALKLIETMAHHSAIALGCESELSVINGYPCLVNDEDLTESAQSHASDLIGMEHIIDLPFRMSAEDFARYTERIPGVFFRLGVGNKAKGITAPVHSPYFDVDEECLFYGASAMAWMAYSYLNKI
jgi:amidohydrolase